MPSEGSRQRRDLEAGVGSLRRMGNGTFTRWETELGRPSPAPGLMIPAEGRPYKLTGERGGRRKGVRGGRSTDEGQDNITCSREGPTGEDMLAKRVSGGHGGAQTPSNHPGRRKPITKTRQLQRKLWTLAKQDKGRRFHALYDRVHRWDVLEESWLRVKRNGGSGGVDGKTIQGIEALGVEDFLKGIERDLKEGTYQPSPVRRVMIPKPDGRKRPLGIPTVRDRAV